MVLIAGCKLGDALSGQEAPFSGLWPACAEECMQRVRDPGHRYINEFKTELMAVGKVHRYNLVS